MYRKRKRSVPMEDVKVKGDRHPRGPPRDRRDYMMMMEGGVNGGGNGYGEPPLAYAPAPASPPPPPIDQNCIFHQVAASPAEVQLAQEHATQATKRVLLHQALLASDTGHHGPQAATERERIDKRIDEEMELSRRVQGLRASEIYATFLPTHQAQALLLPHLEMLWPGGCLLQARTLSNTAANGNGGGGDSGNTAISTASSTAGGNAQDNWLTLSSGLTNPDMPTRFRLERFRLRRGKEDRLASEGGDLDKMGGEIFSSNGVTVFACDRPSHSYAVSLRPRQELDSHWAGYGYEIGILTRGKQAWTAHSLAFMVSKAVMDDYNLRGVIDQFGAATFERMPVQPDRTAHFLIARAPAELYAKEASLLNGSMQLFLMTVITDEELQFGMHNRALDLYHRLRHAGKAFVSDLDRPSIDLQRESDRVADEAAANGDVATLADLLTGGYRVFPGNPILCIAVKKGRDDRSAANVLRFFLDKRWKEGTSGSDREAATNGQAEPRPDGGADDERERRERKENGGGGGGGGAGGVELDEELMRSLAQVRDEDNYTALHWAARNNFAECAQLLVEKGGVDLELRGTRTAVTALHLAANFGSLETLKLLISKGANLNSDALPDRQGEVTPLMLALDSEDERSYKACKLLIQAGVNVNTQDWAGSTVLHKMSRVVPRYLVRAIEFPGKEKGRDVSYFIRDGEFGKRVENRVDERYLHDYPEAEEELFAKYFGAFCPTHKVYLGMLAKLGLLMRSGADAGLRNNAGMLALHNFAGEGGLREVRAVLDFNNAAAAAGSSSTAGEEREANWKKIINARDNAGRTPLWLACAHEKGPELAAKVAHWLLSRGADAALGDDCGVTPLHVAAVFGNLPLAGLLVKHGASPQAPTVRGGGQVLCGPTEHVFPAGVSPLHVAKKEGHFHLLNFFHEVLGP